MQIYEAAELALKEKSKPMHLRDLRKFIEERGYFIFGAKEPERALGVALDRHARGVAISRPSSPQLFYRHAPATYGLLEWLDEDEKESIQLDEDVAAQEELDSSLFLEEELHRWLYKNLEPNGLSALGFGRLTLYSPDEQHLVHGKFDTKIVGEIDFLLQTDQGDFVIIELKRSGDDVTMGQICRYYGWVLEHLAKPQKKQVFGVRLSRFLLAVPAY